MKRLGKFMFGCFGLICGAMLPLMSFMISILLMYYVSIWCAFTFILTLPLSLYLIKVICDLSCTDKFIELAFGDCIDNE